MWTRHAQETEEGLEHINPVRARLLEVFGPADSWDNPLVGTKFDPAVRQKNELERRLARRARRAERKIEHETSHLESLQGTDHYGPDEA